MNLNDIMNEVFMQDGTGVQGAAATSSSNSRDKQKEDRAEMMKSLEPLRKLLEGPIGLELIETIDYDLF